MRLERLVLCLVASMLPIAALAGPGGTSCATAEQISQGATYQGDTSAPGYGNPIGGMGPLPSPANDAIYFLVAGTVTGPVTMVSASYNFGIFLVPDCQPATSPPIQAATGPTTPQSFPLTGLTDGTTYYVIVSGNPADQSAPEGTFTFSTPITPVELQSFEID